MLGGSKLASMSNESEWPARVSAWRASGKSAPEFCADKDYSATTLYWWASRLKREGQPRPGHKPMRLARVVRKSADEASKHAPIVLRVGPARLEIGRGADQTTLSNVLLALAETPWAGER
jgi:transposase